MSDPLKIRCTIYSEVTRSLFDHLNSITNPKVRASVLVSLAQQGLLASNGIAARGASASSLMPAGQPMTVDVAPEISAGDASVYRAPLSVGTEQSIGSTIGKGDERGDQHEKPLNDEQNDLLFSGLGRFLS
ncbi:protein of unknown function (plasmid) [Pararobbsia alpina]|uniref:hypothetical protein n=1 Tax=Pararobbsia alpina TaxID=621374 RepID=UPI0039A45493